MLLKEQKIYYYARVAMAMCFIGHGAFGIITKQVWCNYFGVFGIGEATGLWFNACCRNYRYFNGRSHSCFILHGLLPYGWYSGDYLPPSLRPLSGEPFAEFIERAGNYGAPFAFLLLSAAPLTIKNLFAAQPAPAI